MESALQTVQQPVEINHTNIELVNQLAYPVNDEDQERVQQLRQKLQSKLITK